MSRSDRRTGGRDVAFATTIADSMESFVEPVAQRMADMGYRVHLITGDRPTSASFDHESHVIPMQRGISATDDTRSLRAWVHRLRDIRPGMVVAGTPKASLLGMLAARTVGVPARVYVMHGAVWDGATGTRRRVLETTERITIRASTDQLAVSDSLARLVHTRGLAPRMPDVLGSGSFSGVDLARFHPAEGAHAPAGSICFVGRVNRDKGIDVLIRTFNRVSDRVDAHLTVVGGLDESAPPEAAVMAQLTTHPGITWVGEVTDVPAYLRASRVLLFPTSREGLGQVALEAQACGVPVVSWRVTGVVDAVRDGFTGTLVGFGDEAGLAEAVVRLLTDEAHHRRLAANARLWTAQQFASATVAARTADYLASRLTA
ncbi:MAG: glycosyltransferase [Candidatus Nanopelagicales bacterium]